MINDFGKVLENENLKDYTTYKLSGTIKRVIFPDSLEKLEELIKFLNSKGKKYKVIGSGSNLIFTGDYDGVIVKLDYLNKLIINDTLVTVGAGYNLMKLAVKAASLGLTGLEFAAGIPGTVGASIYGNAGAYNSNMGKIVKRISVMDKGGNIFSLTNEELLFNYRDSKLKYEDLICTEALLELKHGDKAEIMEIIKDEKIKRLKTQPLEYPSAGSVFRNPKGDYAGRLIESLNLKGYKIGGAMVSEKHANFIVSDGTATGEDIKNLIEHIQKEVKNNYNIDLIVEQEIVE